jgi:SAM-dependent methyltransferase
VACDINRELVDFCASAFRRDPVYASENPRDTPLEGAFDLIWCGSPLTHVDAPLWTAFLELFESLLEPAGVLVFSTCGRFVADRVRSSRGIADLSDDQVDFPMTTEVTLATPWWVCARIQEDAPKLDMLGFPAGGSGASVGREPATEQPERPGHRVLHSDARLSCSSPGRPPSPGTMERGLDE